MKKKISVLLTLFLLVACENKKENVATKVKKEEVKKIETINLYEDKNSSGTVVEDNKFVIYQSMVRLFGNKNSTNKFYGTLEENGVGKFNDYTDKALVSLKELGISHMWYTGVIEHASMNDFSKNGIKSDDSDVVKGRAGSPYAIKDYYDVNPDLAVDISKRMDEFVELVERTHKNDMKVIIDFVPNHVARDYNSDAKPSGVEDFGKNDDVTIGFKASNNFYYMPDTKFLPPEGYNPLGDEIAINEDGKFLESPVKATGNDYFTEQPDVDSWFETVKLNYGVDINGDGTNHFSPIPDTWIKMKDILLFWAGKGVDGFRCDMAQMVPVEAWNYLTTEVKKEYPDLIFIAEIYIPSEYEMYIKEGGFDFLYDKVGMYETIRYSMSKKGRVEYIERVWQEETKDISSKMLRFLENHDEERIASEEFSHSPLPGIPGMLITTTFSSGPVLIYFGQELGVAGKGEEGYGGEDGKTTIFDYWGVEKHQRWMNDGKFNNEKLSEEEKLVRDSYSKILNLGKDNEAIRKGELYDLYFANKKGQSENYNDRKIYAYIRYVGNQKILFVINFDLKNSYDTVIKLPERAWELMGYSTKGKYEFKDILFTDTVLNINAVDTIQLGDIKSGLPVNLKPLGVYAFEISEIK